MSVTVNFQPFASQIREVLRTSIEENFQQGGRFGNGPFGGGNTRWKQSQRARTQSGQTLQDTGQLAASIRVNVTGGGSMTLKDGDSRFDVELNGNAFNVEMGSNKPYAQIHQFGGDFNIPVTPTLRKYFWRMHFKERGAATKELRKIYRSRGEKFTKKVKQSAQSGFSTQWQAMAMTKKSQFHIRIPARPFLVIQDEDLVRIQEKFIEFLSAKMI